MDKDYRIGGHRFRVSGEKWLGALSRLEGFAPFAAEAGIEEVPEFVFRGGAGWRAQAFGRMSYAFKYEDIDGAFGVAGDGYLLELRPEGEEPLRMWIGNGETEGELHGNASPRLLRFALWMGYGAMTARKATLAVHGSCIVYHGKAVLFLGESGTGKSTHTRLWREHIAGSALLNDDSPVVRCEADGVWVYGSPWSGKAPCYKAERYPLAACVRLSQAPYNKMEKLDVVRGFAAVHPSAPPAFAYEEGLYEGVSATLGKVLSAVPVYRLACLPDEAAARLACRTLFGG